EAWAAENKITDYLDNGTSGFVRIAAGKVWVPSGDKIQRGINAANTVEAAPVGGDTVYVQAGAYNESPQIGKSLTLAGEGAATTTINLLSTSSPGTAYLAGVDISGSGTAATVSGFTIVGNDAVGSGLANSNIVVETGVQSVSVTNDIVKVAQVGSGTS